MKSGDWEIMGDVGRIEIAGAGVGAYITTEENGTHWVATRLDGISLEGMSDEPGFDDVTARVVIMAVLKAGRRPVDTPGANAN
jgi:hypothetical protein